MKARHIVGIVLVLLVGVPLAATGASEPGRLEYYGVDAAGPSDWPWLASQGVNTVFLPMSGQGVSESTFQAARANNIKLFVWPLGPYEEYTSWQWLGGDNWDISYGTPLLDQLVRNSDVVIAVMTLHEPYWRGGKGAIPATSQTALANMIRDYTRSQGHELDILNLIDAVHVWDNDPPLPGQMDYAGIWLHCWDAEGTEAMARELVQRDRAWLDANLPDVKLVFTIQTFGMDGTAYRMPTYTELRRLSCQLLGDNHLDGFLYYSWGQVSSGYTDWLANTPSLHPIIRDVHDNCAQFKDSGSDPTPTTIPPTSTLTPTPEPTVTNTPEPTVTNTPEPTVTNTPEPGPTVTPGPTDTPPVSPTSEPEPTMTPTPRNTFRVWLPVVLRSRGISSWCWLVGLTW